MTIWTIRSFAAFVAFVAVFVMDKLFYMTRTSFVKGNIIFKHRDNNERKSNTWTSVGPGGCDQAL